MNIKLIGEISGYLAAAIGTIVFLPQVVQSYKSKHTKDVSFLSFLLIAIGSVLWVVYGATINSIQVFVVNIVIFILSVTMLVLKRKYG